MYYWILINMADCLSSSIFSLWPKRNSSSKCTNYEFCVAIHTTQTTPITATATTTTHLHTHARTELVHRGEVKRQMWNDVQPGEMANTLQWWVVMAASHSTQHSDHTTFDAYTGMPPVSTNTCTPTMSSGFVVVNRSALVLAFSAFCIGVCLSFSVE